MIDTTPRKLITPNCARCSRPPTRGADRAESEGAGPGQDVVTNWRRKRLKNEHERAQLIAPALRDLGGCPTSYPPVLGRATSWPNGHRSQGQPIAGALSVTSW